jgi:hypothetical protein
MEVAPARDGRTLRWRRFPIRIVGMHSWQVLAAVLAVVVIAVAVIVTVAVATLTGSAAAGLAGGLVALIAAVSLSWRAIDTFRGPRL